MRWSLFEHENMLTTTDFIFSYLRLKVMGEYYTLLEGHVFERMTQVASTAFKSRKTSDIPCAGYLVRPFSKRYNFNSHCSILETMARLKP